jgi:hypothetical protein
MAPSGKANRYAQIIEKIFLDRHTAGDGEVPFTREDIADAAADLGIDLPKNQGDVLYSFRYRSPLPDSITATASKGNEWIIEGAGRSKYLFRCVPLGNLEPSVGLAETKIPDATPGLIDLYALSDEQALLAKLRYNRLIDIFLGITCYSLQNHLRTTVPNLGQVETDEVYIGIDKRGAQFVVPVQAKGGSDRSSTVQIAQDFRLSAHHFPELIALPVAAQFMADDVIALFVFELSDGHPRISSEKHYRLVQGDELSAGEVRAYQARPVG